MKGKRVLVVDDEEAVLKAITLALVHVGHTVEVAESGLVALSKLAEKTFDVLLTDLFMPGMSGDELAREVNQRHPTLPIVMITATVPASLPGVACILAKPFSVQDLWKVVLQATSDPPDQGALPVPP